jgi:hypothetical protein
MSMIERALRSAQSEFYDLADSATGSDAFLAYVRSYRLDVMAVGWHVGVTAVLPITEHPDSRFDFADAGDSGFICECYGADGETVTDLVAWRLDAPERPLTMFGRCGLLGLWQANAPGTYFMGGTLHLHRSPLLWLQAGCGGAAIVDRHIAGRQLLDVPGRISVEDKVHGREIAALLRAAADIDNKVVAPLRQRSAA